MVLNPHTPLESIRWILPDLAMVLIMSVNPGFGGQRFIEPALTKIAQLRRMIDEAISQAPVTVVLVSEQTAEQDYVQYAVRRPK